MSNVSKCKNENCIRKHLIVCNNFENNGNQRRNKLYVYQHVGKANVSYFNAALVQIAGSNNFRWMQMNADEWRWRHMQAYECRWMHMNADRCIRLQMDYYRWVQMNEDKWLGCKLIFNWFRWLNANERMWMNIYENECMCININEDECIWIYMSFIWIRMKAYEWKWMKMLEVLIIINRMNANKWSWFRQ